MFAFSNGVGHFKCKFQLEGDIAHQPLLVSEKQMITISYGIKLSAVRSFMSSQSTLVMDSQTDGQNYNN